MTLGVLTVPLGDRRLRKASRRALTCDVRNRTRRRLLGGV